MAEVKWIKLNTDLFNNSKIKYLRRVPAGNDMILFWVMLLTKAGRCNSHGYIMLTENIAYDAEMLSDEFEIELNTIRVALGLFRKLQMIDMDNEKIVISGWSEHQSLEKMERVKEQNRVRKQKEREKKKLLAEENTNVTRDSHATVTRNHATDKEEDIDKDIDKDIELLQVVVVENKKIFEIYEQCGFGTLNKYIADELTTLIEQYSFAWVKDSLEKSAEQGKCKLSYVKGILKNWKADGRDSEKNAKSNISSGSKLNDEGIGL